jgi:predicted short-subunit dehydrogenase-like oxidoreductase (DUF2520 family)
VERDAELTLLCVPDTPFGTWPGDCPRTRLDRTCQRSPLSALDPHEQRFSLHPLQTFTRERGPEQLDGAWAAVTAETDEARALGFELARVLGLEPFELADEARPLYHAGAAIASNYLVTLHRVASELFAAAGAPPEALEPLMLRTIENDFELTGPISRGGWSTVDAHLAAIPQRAPTSSPSRRVAEATARIVRTAEELRLSPQGSIGLCRRWAPSTRATCRSSAPRVP